MLPAPILLECRPDGYRDNLFTTTGVPRKIRGNVVTFMNGFNALSNTTRTIKYQLFNYFDFDIRQWQGNNNGLVSK